MTLGIILLIIGVFLVINALYVGAEFALVGAPKAAIEHRAGQGDRMSQRLTRLIDSSQEQDRYIATAQIGITVASLGLGMFGEHGLADWLVPRLSWMHEYRLITAHSVASVLAVIALTCGHIVIGEMLPKSLALQHTERAARWLYLANALVVDADVPVRLCVQHDRGRLPARGRCASQCALGRAVAHV